MGRKVITNQPRALRQPSPDYSSPDNSSSQPWLSKPQRDWNSVANFEREQSHCMTTRNYWHGQVQGQPVSFRTKVMIFSFHFYLFSTFTSNAISSQNFLRLCDTEPVSKKGNCKHLLEMGSWLLQKRIKILKEHSRAFGSTCKLWNFFLLPSFKYPHSRRHCFEL